MQITQAYARASTVAARGAGLTFEMAAEISRPAVRLEALVHHSTSYGRAMLALQRVVACHASFERKEHSAYQQWLQARYLEELPAVLAEQAVAVSAATLQLQSLSEQEKPLRKRERELQVQLQTGSGPLPMLFEQARRRYWDYLYRHHADLWMILDPVVSVHPDVVLFEVFSRDESIYGCVRVPVENLEIFGQTVYGTTNVDFSRRLADEMYRVRDYRPAFLTVGAEGVSVQTTAGSRLEKQIDLPDSWLRGFLQVQSASALPMTPVRLSAATAGEILRRLRSHRERSGPRSLKFHLVVGEFPIIEIEPTGERVREVDHRYHGESCEVRIWGRRRLFVLEEMLPYAPAVEVRLLGSGLPSFWALELEGHRFELGLSGWTNNDWSGSARFDLLAAVGEPPQAEAEVAASHLERSLRLSPEELAARSDLERRSATAALQHLCRQGRAMFDAVAGVYRWRQLLPFAAPVEEQDAKVRQARQCLDGGQVKVNELTGEQLQDNDFLRRVIERGLRLSRVSVSTKRKKFEVLIGLDCDGRAAFSQCSCAAWRREKGRTGPCAHIIAGVYAVNATAGAAVPQAQEVPG